MEWTRSDVIALVKPSCAVCHGEGLRVGKRGEATPCNCVLRAIFRACYARFRDCVEREKDMTTVRFERIGGPRNLCTWGRKNEEYIADFQLIARRSLDELEHSIFRYHFLLGADWRLCCGRLNLDRGNFFHAVYRIQQKLGRVFRELQPYGLYPVNEYFQGAGVVRKPTAYERAESIFNLPKRGLPLLPKSA